MPDREKAFEARDGIIMDSKNRLSHCSTGLGAPTHTGKLGDLYWEADKGSWWNLPADGNAWVQATSVGTPHLIPLYSQGNTPYGTFLGYSANSPGDSTPVVLPRKSRFDHISFSNSKTTADYTLDFRINSLVVAPFESITKVNTQFFAEDTTAAQIFEQGDQFYVQINGSGNAPKDTSIILSFTGVV